MDTKITNDVLLKRIERLGFESPAAFFSTKATATYEELASLLGRTVAPVQVEKLHWDLTSKAPTDLRATALDSLSRILSDARFRGGWSAHDTASLARLASAYSQWSGAMLTHKPQSDLKRRAEGVFKALLTESPPPNWTCRVNDPYLTSTFAKGWDAT